MIAGVPTGETGHALEGLLTHSWSVKIAVLDDSVIIKMVPHHYLADSSPLCDLDWANYSACPVMSQPPMTDRKNAMWQIEYPTDMLQGQQETVHTSHAVMRLIRV